MLGVFSFYGLWHQITWSYYPKDEIGLKIPAGSMPAEIEGVVRTTPVFYESAFDESGGGLRGLGGGDDPFGAGNMRACAGGAHLYGKKSFHGSRGYSTTIAAGYGKIQTCNSLDRLPLRH